MKQLLTPWGENIDKSKVLNEYPRPQMVRDSYLSLNGYWDYAISKKAEIKNYDGKILVPFSPESILSDVNKILGEDEFLHYYREVKLPSNFMKDRLILHFGAVDQEAEVFINDQLVIRHLGGFTPFSVDITEFVTCDSFSIKLKVKDVTDTSFRQTGKQRIKRGGIFYTQQSGIWQSVWLESVPFNYIEKLIITTDFDNSKVLFKIISSVDKPTNNNIKISFNNNLTCEKNFQDNLVEITLDNFFAWSPEEPNLYDFEIVYEEDLVKGYFGMRKFERKADDYGVMRFFLNNKPYFLSGVLDQGYYPDGLLTAPSDKAFIFDLQSMKDLGFNFIRKHIKIEPLRWYYHCDRLGLIVWQDMVNGSSRKDIIFHGALALANIHLSDKLYFLFGRKSKEGRNQFIKELDEMINHLINITCISTWVPFNEAWGQFDALKIEQHLRLLDKTRLIDHASGWSDQSGGDYFSRHIYFKKIRFNKQKSRKRIIALTEFGGYSLLIESNSFMPEKVFGYKRFSTKEELEKALKKLYIEEVIPELENGLSVLVYTQLSDVEEEVNGFLTYDRLVLKVSKDFMKEINKLLTEKFASLIKIN